MNIYETIANLVASKIPDADKNPRQKELLDILRSGDAKKGEEFAENYCKSMGKSKDEVLKESKKFFGFN